MESNNSFVHQIFKNVSFTEAEVQLIEKNFEKIHLKKGSILLKADEKVTHQYFVVKGCLRTFFSDAKGKEHTVQFAIKDWWISDFTAVFTESKAIMNIECIHDATLYKIARKDINILFEKIKPLDTFFRIKLEKAYANFQKRILESLSLPAKQRYISFIQKYPNIEQSVKNYHIASYLGITTESLSRIRKTLKDTTS